MSVGFAPTNGWAQTTLDVSPRILAFSGVVGGGAPASQNAAITSAVTERLDFTVELESLSPGTQNWLVIRPQRATTPARVQFAVDQSGLGAGAYTARVVVLSGADRVPVDITLTLVERPPALQIAPQSLKFSYGETDSPEQLLFLTNAGGGPASYRASVVRGTDWLSVSPEAGTALPNQPGLLRVAVHRNKTKPVDYGIVRVQSGNDSIDVPVIALSAQGGPILGLNATGLTFEARQGEGHSNIRNVLVSNPGDGVLEWQAEVLRGQGWLVLSSGAGRVETGALGRLGLNAEPASLPPGAYYALVRVSAPGAASSPQYISSVLNVTSADDPPVPDPSPQGLFFAGAPDDSPPQPQPIRVFVSSRDAVQFQVSATTADGIDWLRVEPQSGFTSTLNTAALRVSVNPSVLKPGIYTGDVTVAFADRTIRTTNITFVVRPEAANAAQAKGPRAAASCQAKRLSLTHTGLVNSFTSPAGWPNLLIVRLADDCGEPVLNASVVATFSNNDSPLTMKLTNSQIGLYSATWLPSRKGTVVVAATAAAAGLQTARAEIIGGVTESKEPPQLYPGSVRSLFDPVPGAPLVPGMPVQLFGSALSSGTGSAATLPLPSTLAQTSMLVGATAAPLFFVSPEQVNAQIPPELTANREYATVIVSGNRYSAVDSLILAAVRPALVANDTVALAQHADGSPVSGQAPARTGEEIALFAVGLGATDPTVGGGALPESGIPARVRSLPRVTMGGRDAVVRDAALADDVVGIYRVWVQVPAGLPAGSHEIEIEQQGIVGNRAIVPVSSRD